MSAEVEVGTEDFIVLLVVDVITDLSMIIGGIFPDVADVLDPTLIEDAEVEEDKMSPDPIGGSEEENIDVGNDDSACLVTFGSTLLLVANVDSGMVGSFVSVVVEPGVMVVLTDDTDSVELLAVELGAISGAATEIGFSVI